MLPTSDPVMMILASIETQAALLNYIDKERLWNILTALRGPDIEPDTSFNSTLKNHTTAIIRGLTLPILAAQSNAIVLSQDGPYSQPYAPSLIPTARQWSHFRSHIFAAGHALELSEDPADKAKLDQMKRRYGWN